LNTNDEKVVNVMSDGTQRENVVDVKSFRQLIRALAADQVDPVVGDIWKTRWHSSVQIVTVIADNSDGANVIPLSYDVALADDSSVQLSVADQSLGYAVVAWTSLSRVIPLCAFDVKLGELGANGLASVAAPIGGGTSPLSSLDERSQVRDAIDERMDKLAHANWLPDADTSIDLATAIRDRNVKISDIARLLNIEPGFATALVRGDRKLTASQSTVLSEFLDLDEHSQTINPRVDPILVHELNRPLYRRRLWQKGLERGATDEAVWRYEVATVLPIAARTTSHQSPRERWAGLIEDFLRAD
jgi:hypothetical protein